MLKQKAGKQIVPLLSTVSCVTVSCVNIVYFSAPLISCLRCKHLMFYYSSFKRKYFRVFNRSLYIRIDFCYIKCASRLFCNKRLEDVH